MSAVLSCSFRLPARRPPRSSSGLDVFFADGLETIAVASSEQDVLAERDGFRFFIVAVLIFWKFYQLHEYSLDAQSTFCEAQSNKLTCSHSPINVIRYATNYHFSILKME